MPPLSASDGRNSRPRIVIVGANFAGLTAAQHLGREYAVTVIDSSSSFEWLPTFIAAVWCEAAGDPPAGAPAPGRKNRHRFVRATVIAIDPRAAKVITADGGQFEFDACIVPWAGVNDTFGVPGAERYAMPFKSVDHCDAIGGRSPGSHGGRGALSVVIVGGGLEGVEALGEVLPTLSYRSQLTIRVHRGAPTLLPARRCPSTRQCARRLRPVRRRALPHSHPGHQSDEEPGHLSSGRAFTRTLRSGREERPHRSSCRLRVSSTGPSNGPQ